MTQFDYDSFRGIELDLLYWSVLGNRLHRLAFGQLSKLCNNDLIDENADTAVTIPRSCDKGVGIEIPVIVQNVCGYSIDSDCCMIILSFPFLRPFYKFRLYIQSLTESINRADLGLKRLDWSLEITILSDDLREVLSEILSSLVSCSRANLHHLSKVSGTSTRLIRQLTTWNTRSVLCCRLNFPTFYHLHPRHMY